jgi:hypothetical protein
VTFLKIPKNKDSNAKNSSTDVMKNHKVTKGQIPKSSGAPSARGTLVELCSLGFEIFLGFGPLAFGI